MAVHAGFRVQMTAKKRALEYWVSRRKGLTIFILHTILYITKLSVAPIIRAIASNCFITAKIHWRGFERQRSQPD